MVLALLDTLLTFAFFAVFAWVILSWIPMSPGHPLGRVQSFLDRLIYPILRPIRSVVPPIRFSGGAIDLSPLILLLAIQILRGLI